MNKLPFIKLAQDRKLSAPPGGTVPGQPVARPVAPAGTVPGKPAAPPAPATTPVDLGDVDSPSFNKPQAAAPAPAAAPAAGQRASGGTSLPSVVAMQKEITEVAKDISSHSFNTAAKDGKNKKGESLGGADPFSSFLVKQYMGKSDIKGKTYQNTTVAQPTRTDASIDNENLTAVLGTISRIGTGANGAEQAPDGIWGGRTDNALKQVYALAYALMNMEKDMNLSDTLYKDADLKDFSANIAQDSKSMNDQQKDAKAKVLTTTLSKFRKFYSSFREKVLDNKDTNALITQQKAFSSKQNDDSKSLVGNDIKYLYEPNKNVPIKISINEKLVSITPADLESSASFKKYLQNTSKSYPDIIPPADLSSSDKINNYLSQINTQLAGA